MNNKRMYATVLMVVCLMVIPGCTIPFSPDKPDIKFSATDMSLELDECTFLFWEVEDGTNVRLNNETVTSVGTRQVCPTSTTSYILSYEFSDGAQFSQLTILVNDQSGSSTQEQEEVSLDFWADKTTINKGECTTLHWRTSGGGVYLGEQNVSPSGEMEVCPVESKEYFLEIGDELASKTIVIDVQAGSSQSSGDSQQQPAQQQPTQQQPAQPKSPSNPGYLEILEFQECCCDGEPFALVLNRPISLAVYDIYVGGILVKPSEVTSDFQTFVLYVPSGRKDDYVEVKGEGLVARREFWLISDDELPKSTDLAITELYTDNMPRGKIFAHLTNRGPQAIINSNVELACEATLVPKSGSTNGWNDFVIKQVSLSITLLHNQTLVFETGIENESDLYSYLVSCRVFASAGTYSSKFCGRTIQLEESNPSNNTFKKDFPFFFSPN